jgi:formylmethanofuran dehydrogenase subunit B
MSYECDSLDIVEKAAVGAELNRCRVLAAKIANELRNKRPEQFADRWSLADIHSSLERAADVLSTLDDSLAQGRQHHW